MRFEWDQAKSEINRRKHGISFDEARDVFDDPLHLSILDERTAWAGSHLLTRDSAASGAASLQAARERDALRDDEELV